MKDFVISMLSKYGKVSSKRFWGSATAAVVLIAFLYCVFKQYEMPEITYALISYSAILLGIETVFTKNGVVNNTEKKTDESEI